MDSQRFGYHTLYLDDLGEQCMEKGLAPLPLISATFSVTDKERHEKIVGSFVRTVAQWWEQTCREESE